MSDEYKRAFHRLSTGLEQTANRWDKSPDIQPDLIAEYEALQAWVWIPNCYSLIEQSFKLIWMIRKNIPVGEVIKELKKLLRNGWQQKAHDLTVLFGLLTSDDKRRIENAYRAYQDLHDYIPILTAKEFLAETGKGYGSWRYLLLQGTGDLPKTHIGAMLEIARACVTILENELFNRNDSHTVDERIKWALNQAVFREAHACADYHREQNSDSTDFQEVFNRCKKYVDDLINQNSHLAYKVLSGDVSRNVDEPLEKFGGSAIVRRICNALSKTDTKNSRQFFLKKSRNNQNHQNSSDLRTSTPLKSKRESREDDSIWETFD